MNRAELLESWLWEERQPFSGWDVSYLEGRMSGDQEFFAGKFLIEARKP